MSAEGGVIWLVSNQALQLLDVAWKITWVLLGIQCETNSDDYGNTNAVSTRRFSSLAASCFHFLNSIEGILRLIRFNGIVVSHCSSLSVMEREGYTISFHVGKR